MTDLTGKTVYIAGASRGIGAAAARAFAAAGARVALAARNTDRVEAIAGDIRAAGGQASFHACDVADYAQVAAFAEAACKALGPADILINNAGVIEPIGDVLETDPADWARAIRINLTGAYHVVRAIVPTMVAAGGGTVITISSGAASNILEGWSSYCASKAGLTMLTRALATEHGETIRAFGFRPGVVDTEMQVTIRASGINRVSQIPRGDLAPPSEPAKAMLWLCTPAADRWAGGEIDIRDPEARPLMGL